VVGTTGAVYPAAALVHTARAAGARVVVVDPGPTEYDEVADVRIYGPAGDAVPAILA
jgi:NAD-dependent deacetylase